MVVGSWNSNPAPGYNMKTAKIFSYLKYLILNPDYFFYYFYRKPEKIIMKLTGADESIFFKFKNDLDNDSTFSDVLNKKTQEILRVDFSLDIDHYFLYSLIRTIKPSIILETGVYHGYYTSCMLKGINDNHRDDSINGKLISIDLPAYKTIAESTNESPYITHLPPGYGPGWVIPDYLKDRWQLHIGDSRKLLPIILNRENNISLFFHDSLHTYSHMTYEFETVYSKLDYGEYLMSHDIHWNRAFRHFLKKHGQKGFSIHGFGVFRKATRNKKQ
jgi:hypothetical protein